jgi:hypothetical protein
MRALYKAMENAGDNHWQRRRITSPTDNAIVPALATLWPTRCNGRKR